MIRKFFRLFFLVSIVLVGCGGGKTSTTTSTTTTSAAESREKANEIRILHFNSVPHIYEDESGKLTGAIYDFIQEGIAPEMGIKFNWVKDSTAIPRQIEILQKEANTAVALLSKNEERAKIIAYTETPYFQDTPTLALLKTNPLNKINSIDDILKLKIGYAEAAFLTPLMRNDAIDFDLISNSNYHETNINKLNIGRIDAVYAPGKTTLAVILEKLNFTDKIKLLDLPDQKGDYYIIFSKLSAELVLKYNAAFKKINGTEFYLQKLKKYVDISLLK